MIFDIQTDWPFKCDFFFFYIKDGHWTIQLAKCKFAEASSNC